MRDWKFQEQHGDDRSHIEISTTGLSIMAGNYKS
jgi:hypothetical protein